MNILLTGATGMIGQELGLALTRHGHNVIGLTRDKKKALLTAPYPADWIEADLAVAPFDPGFYKIDGVIHLAGENVGEKSWSSSQKERILRSRVQGTRNLLKSLEHIPLQFFIGASAIGFYGDVKTDTPLNEMSAPGEGFLSEVATAWEKESIALRAETRRVLFRIGVVLSMEGGALPQMVFPAQIFASSSLGNGQQWLSWIHLQDVVGAFLHAIHRPEMSGVYNLAADPVRQKQMAQEIAQQMGALNGPPVPKMVIRTLLGEQGELALMSIPVSNAKLLATGYQFVFSTLSSALKDLLGDWHDGVAVKKYRQYLPYDLKDVFDFFSVAENLEKITPDFMNFHVEKSSTPKIEKDTKIDYRLKLHGLPLRWQSKIESWVPQKEFVDTQTRGPFALWHHTHRFEALPSGGTLMTDVVRYKLPAGILGRLFAQKFVDNDVDRIFRFRREVAGRFVGESVSGYKANGKS